MFREKFNTTSGLDKIEGVITLKLHNAKTGRLEQEVVTKNFIATPAIRYHQWTQRNYVKSGIYNLQNDRDSDHRPASMFDTLYLSDSTIAEDSNNELMVPGKIIGYATKSNYSGTSTYRGTVIAGNSEATTMYSKWTFQWPALAANGTIGSVGWMGSLSHESFNTLSPVNGNGTIVSVQPTSYLWGAFTQVDSDLAFAVNSAGNRSINLPTTIRKVDSSYTEINSYQASGQFTNLRGIAWDSGNARLWVIGVNGSACRIAAYDIDGNIVISPISITTRLYKTLAFDGSSLWSAEQDGTNVTIYKIDPSDGSELSSFSFEASTPSTNQTEILSGMCWHPDRQELWIKTSIYASRNYHGGRFISFDSEGNITTAPTSMSIWSPSFTGSRSGMSSRYDHVLADFDIFNPGLNIFAASADSNYWSNTSYIYHLQPDSLGSRSQLQTPVTKTDQQTLTVTYQINYPYPGVY